MKPKADAATASDTPQTGDHTVESPVSASAKGDDDADVANEQRHAGRVVSRTKVALAFGLVTIAAVGGISGWLGYRSYHTKQLQAQNTTYVDVARQAAINLTTISYTEADADVRRILDSATGAFRDDFQQRSQPFVDVVKKTQSKSQGAVTAAGLESRNGDLAKVLVAVSVTTSTAATPEQAPRGWRMRMSLQRTPDGVKISNVEFVP